MNAQVRSQSVGWLQVVACSLLTLISPIRLGRSAHKPPSQCNFWIGLRSKDSGRLDQQLRKRLNQLTEFFIRITSPDVPQSHARLWRIAVDGSQNCRLSDDTGVSDPRWGAGGFILYLQEEDTNKDGRIDFTDDFLIRIVHAPEGGAARTVAQGTSPRSGLQMVDILVLYKMISFLWPQFVGTFFLLGTPCPQAK